MRMGKRKQPTYRVVAADRRKARNGRFIEAIGFYDPRREPSVIKIENEKALRWLNEGAQPSERVEKLLKISGAWDEFKGLPQGTSVIAAPIAPSSSVSPVTVDSEIEVSTARAPVDDPLGTTDDEAVSQEAEDGSIEEVGEGGSTEHLEDDNEESL